MENETRHHAIIVDQAAIDHINSLAASLAEKDRIIAALRRAAEETCAAYESDDPQVFLAATDKLEQAIANAKEQTDGTS